MQRDLHCRHKIERTFMPNKIKEKTERLFFFCQQFSLGARNHQRTADGPHATKSVLFFVIDCIYF